MRLEMFKIKILSYHIPADLALRALARFSPSKPRPFGPRRILAPPLAKS